MRRFLLSACSALFVIGAGFTWLSDARDQGEEAMIQRRYQEAVEHLQKALTEETEGERDSVLFLLGRAQALAGSHDDAVATFRRLMTTFPQSAHVAKARFSAADSLAASGDFAGAATIYREEIERLVSLDRKEQVAAIYLGLAEKALEKEPVDHARAVVFYDLALDLGLSPAKARSVRLAAAESRLAEGQAPDAVRRFEPLVDELSAEDGLHRAMLGLGRAKLAAGDRAGARRVLRDLIRRAPASGEAGDAAYQIALTFGVPTPDAGSLDRAVAALRDLAERYPTHEQAVLADFIIAQCYRYVGRTEQSLAALQSFLAAHADRDLEEVAAARAMVGDVLESQAKHEDAITAWREYLSAHPAHEEWERVQRAIVSAEYQIALDAYNAEEFGEARERLAAFARAYPLDGRNPGILLLYGEMLRAEKKFDEARAAYERCVSKYPGKDASSCAQFRIGEIFETETFNYLQALRAYRKVTWGAWAQRASQRIVQLERKSLRLETPRSYRTGEPAVFELTSRNIEKVRVRVFRLDLETYFRATHVADSVEQLDIEVIEPDKVFESQVPEYQKYQQTEREVDIGYSEPGAYIVKVDDAELEATTMVLVTDVALIVKSSRHELFVFSQNVKENRVESGMRVVVSDGSKVIAEGTTGTDGVWRYQGEELQQREQLRVFAVNGSGSGAGNLSLSGLGYSVGLTPRGLLTTDRPAYQPGQVAHIKGILREVANGLYRLPADERYRLQVISASGRLMLQEDLSLTDFGTFAADVALPSNADLGTWQVRVDRAPFGGAEFHGTFVVARYERPRMSLAVEPSKSVVYRGEPIEGVIRLAYYFGEPVVGKSVTYWMPLRDGSVVERSGVTNATGEVPFRFETGEFREDDVASIEARVADENLIRRGFVQVATTEFTPKVETMRSVYLVGESFDTTVTLVDRSGQPVARKGVARLMRHEKRGNSISEIEVASAEFATDAADGRAKVVFESGQGGRHVVRVEAIDRFGTPVTGEVSLTVSGEDDEIKLRILSDAETYEVGDRVTVRVLNRSGPRLALRTLQGDGILAYEAVSLPAGESEHELRLEPMHAPNFGLALAVVADDRLLTAQRDFVVSRAMELTVRSKVAEAEPGSEIEVEIEARDPMGQPVQAEVAVAMVDRALLAVHADTTPEIGSFFYGARRETEFRTVSSCTWSYAGESRRVSADLVAEDRRELYQDTEIAEEIAFDSDSFNTAIGLGGSAGGRFGGRARASVRGQAMQLGQDVQLVMVPQSETLSNFERVSLGVPPLQAGTVLRELDSVGTRRGYLRFPVGEPIATRRSDEPRRDFSELGAWISSVVTGADGKAVAKIRLPHSTTSWALTARGVTVDTYVGQADGELVTSLDLQADLVAPRVLTEGDQTQLRLRAHNLTDDDRNVNLQLVVEAGKQKMAHERSQQLLAHREGEVAFPFSAASTDDVMLKASASSGDLVDRTEYAIGVLPWGVEYRDGRAGVTREGASFSLSLPPRREYTALSLEIGVGPDPGRDLVSAALGFGFRPFQCRTVDATNTSLASRGLGASVVLSYLERVGGQADVDATQLRGLIGAAVSRLLSVQRDDGSWAWIGAGDPDATTTAQAVRFLSAAVNQGFVHARPGLDRAAEWLVGQVRTLRGADRVHVAQALAEVGRAGFELLNTLHRGKAKLDPASLARLALAWHQSGRAGLAAEASAILRANMNLSGGADPVRVEAIALAVSALSREGAAATEVQRAVRWLQEQRVGVSWGTPAATAAALEALTAVGGFDTAAGDSAEIRVVVNGQEVTVVERGGERELVTVGVPRELLRDQGNEIAIAVQGRGVIHYTATLTGFARGFRKEDRREDLVQLRRNYYPAVRRHDGRDLPSGFDVVRGRFERFQNAMTQLEAGGSGRVETYFYVPEGFREQLSPLVIEEPIPAGCSVPRDSIRGQFDHFVLEPGKITFFYREGRYSDRIRYELLGRFPGDYRALPTRAYGAQRPDLLAHGPAMKLTILPRGTATSDTYRMTPDELFRLGSALYEAGDLAAAGGHFESLLSTWHRSEHQLRDDVFREVARMMLFISVARGDDAGTVRFFEELKDRYENLVIPFDKVLAVGKAYLDLGEFERALMVFKGTAEASFLKEAAVASTLEELGEIRASVGFLRELLGTYPDLNTIRLSLYSIGQQLSGLAAAMPKGVAVDDRVGSAADLRATAVRAFREFCLLYPEDPLAEEVSFAWATTHIEGEDLKRAKQVAEAALARYPETSFEDELLYTAGFIEFALGQHEVAFDLLRRVADEGFRSPDGRKGPSENRDGAIYLQGQIHHARGEPAKALEMYGKVDDKFSDADEASHYFRQKRLALPEVSTFGLDQKVEISLDYRNLERVRLVVYRVDLMRLYLMEKSLNNIRDILLHGIRPYAEQTVELGDGKDYADRKKVLPLELVDPGAYLVVVRGSDLIATGMVLRSDLVIEAQEQFDVGRVRVNVKSGDGYVNDAHVKVIGSGDQEFRSGDSDLRGIYVADQLVGRATVIVKKGDQYAFFRGVGIHQPSQYRAPAAPRSAPTTPGELEPKGKKVQFDGWKQNMFYNDLNRARQVEWLRDEVKNVQQKGVEVYRTK